MNLASRSFVVWAALILGGCIEADLDEDVNGYYTCDGEEDCPPGKVCAHGRCYDAPAPECSPFDSSGCGPDRTCVIFEGGAPGCTTPGTQSFNESCDGDLECARGLLPVNYFFDGEFVGCLCSDYCRDDADCSPGRRCTDDLTISDTHGRWGPVPIGLCE